MTPPLFHLFFAIFPLHHFAHIGASPSRSLKLFGREIIFEVFQPMWSRYLNVKAGQNVLAIQGHGFWYQSKARMGLPINPSL